MARNQVQFQRGLGMAEFNRRYGNEDQCHAALVGMRWPEGFVCPKCAGRTHSYCALPGGTRGALGRAKIIFAQPRPCADVVSLARAGW